MQKWPLTQDIKVARQRYIQLFMTEAINNCRIELLFVWYLYYSINFSFVCSFVIFSLLRGLTKRVMIPRSVSINIFLQYNLSLMTK